MTAKRIELPYKLKVLEVDGKEVDGETIELSIATETALTMIALGDGKMTIETWEKEKEGT